MNDHITASFQVLVNDHWMIIAAVGFALLWVLWELRALENSRVIVYDTPWEPMERYEPTGRTIHAGEMVYSTAGGDLIGVAHSPVHEEFPLRWRFETRTVYQMPPKVTSRAPHPGNGRTPPRQEYPVECVSCGGRSVERLCPYCGNPKEGK